MSGMTFTRSIVCACITLALALTGPAARAADDAKDDAVVLPDKAKVHVYLLMGQSNMAGRGPLTEADKQPTPRVVMLDKHNHWTPARHPVHFDKPIAAYGLSIDFAKTMLAQEKDKDVVIALVPCAVGGTPLSRWVKDGDLYKNAMARAKIALKDGTLKGMLWHQGESDTGKDETTDTYGERLAGMIASVRQELEAPELPVVVGELGRFFVARVPRGEKINAALNALPEHVEHTACASSEGLEHKGDKTHFNTEALKTFGERYAAKMIALQSK
ncbi:MAG: sialate O-acetylesterase [Phycisphaera sp.]|nr:sialate O-acetylesterase [Phycisphaera sp.]